MKSQYAQDSLSWELDDSLYKSMTATVPQSIVSSAYYDTQSNTVNIISSWGRIAYKQINSTQWSFLKSTTTTERYTSRIVRHDNTILYTAAVYADNQAGIHRVTVLEGGGNISNFYTFGTATTVSPRYAGLEKLADNKFILAVNNIKANATDSGYLYTSTDGITWTALSSLRSIANANWNKGVVNAIYPHYNNANRFFIVGAKPATADTDTDTAAVYMTIDGGATAGGWINLTGAFNSLGWDLVTGSITAVKSTEHGFFFGHSSGSMALYNDATNTWTYVGENSAYPTFGTGGYPVTAISANYGNINTNVAFYGSKGQLLIYDTVTGAKTTSTALYSLTGGVDPTGEQYFVSATVPNNSTSYALVISKKIVGNNSRFSAGASYEYIGAAWSNTSNDVFNTTKAMTASNTSNGEGCLTVSADQSTLLVYDYLSNSFAYRTNNIATGAWSSAWNVSYNTPNLPVAYPTNIQYASKGSEILIYNVGTSNLLKFNQGSLVSLPVTNFAPVSGAIGADSNSYYYINNSGAIQKSTDGIAWTNVQTISIFNTTIMSCANNKMFIHGMATAANLPSLAYSNDGWQTFQDLTGAIPVPAGTGSRTITSVLYVSGVYYVLMAIGDGSLYVHTSPDLSNGSWTTSSVINVGFSAQRSYMLYANGKFAIVSSSLHTGSTNGTTWSNFSSNFRDNIILGKNYGIFGGYSGAGGVYGKRIVTIGSKFVYVNDSPIARAFITYSY